MGKFYKRLGDFKIVFNKLSIEIREFQKRLYIFDNTKYRLFKNRRNFFGVNFNVVSFYYIF